MITVNGVTRDHQEYLSPSYFELKQEVARRGIFVGEPVTKQKLIDALKDTEERLLRRKDVIAYAAFTDLVIAGPGTHEKITQGVGFRPYIVGITPAGEITTLELGKKGVVLHLRIFGSYLNLLREKYLSSLQGGETSSGIISQLSGNRLAIVEKEKKKLYKVSDEGDEEGEESPKSVANSKGEEVIKIVDVRTLEVRILPGSEGGYSDISLKENHLIVHNFERNVISLWDLEEGRIVSELSTKDYIGDEVFPEVFNLLLIDLSHFSIANTEGTYLFTLTGKEWKMSTVERDAGKAYGVCGGRLLTVSDNYLNVYDISGGEPVKLFDILVPLFKGDSDQILLTEMRDSRVVCVTDDHMLLIIDLERERVTKYEEHSGAEDIFYLPPDETERREFQELIRGSVSSNVPSAVADIIERFI